MGRDELSIQWGRNIRQWRIGHGTPAKPDRTQSQCAEAVGVREPTWSRWEHGKIRPRLEHQIAIAEFLGVPHHLLFPLPAKAR